MLINKLQSAEDFKNLREIPKEYFTHFKENTPEYLLHLISMIVAVFLYRLNIPRNEVEQFVDKIERREFDMLFDSVAVYDVQEIRRISRAEGKAEILNAWCKLAARSESMESFREAAGI